MKLVALICTRNSEWVIGLSLRAALMVADEAVVLMHTCTDRTLDICQEVEREHPGRVVISAQYLTDQTWREMEQRQHMLDIARKMKATHILLIDDDELLSADMLTVFRSMVQMLPAGRILEMHWLQLRDGIGHVMTTGMWGQSRVNVAFADNPRYHWKAQGPEGYDFHHRHPMGAQVIPYYPQLARTNGMMHLQFASRRRLLAKQAHYQAVETIRWPNRKMADYVRTVRESEAAAVAPVPDSWWAPYSHLMQYLDLDSPPWQEAELKRMVAEYGRERFAGCDFFGVL